MWGEEYVQSYARGYTMIYDNSLRPATLLGLVLLVLALTAAVTWFGALLDPDTLSFDAAGLIVLGLALGCAVLSLLVVLHIHWVRVTMSVLLHLSIVALSGRGQPDQQAG